jgi:outer membrane receptor for Fe3+-dicitrate
MSVNVGESFDRVHKLLEEMKDLPEESILARVQSIEKDIEILFKKMEELHALSEEFRQVDLSDDVYYLFRLVSAQKQKEVSRRFPLLSRAAGLFNL